MGWSVKFSNTAIKQLKKIDKKWQAKILDFLEDEIASSDDPEMRGKILTGDRKGLWRYRIGDYRIICDIRYNELVIIAVGYRVNSQRATQLITIGNPNSHRYSLRKCRTKCSGQSPVRLQPNLLNLPIQCFPG